MRKIGAQRICIYTWIVSKPRFWNTEDRYIHRGILISVKQRSKFPCVGLYTDPLCSKIMVLIRSIYYLQSKNKTPDKPILILASLTLTLPVSTRKTIKTLT